MKRPGLLPLFVAIYAIGGVALLWNTSSPSKRSDSGGAVRWNPFTEKMTIRVNTRHAIINLDEIDLGRTEFVCDHPDATIILRVTGGNPTHLTGKLPDNVMLVNPAGVFVGPESVVLPGDRFGTTIPDFGDVIGGNEILDAPEFVKEPQLGNVVRRSDGSTSAVELKAHGNVYALAIRRDGSIRTSERGTDDRPRTIPSREPGRVLLTAPDKAKTE